MKNKIVGWLLVVLAMLVMANGFFFTYALLFTAFGINVAGALPQGLIGLYLLSVVSTIIMLVLFSGGGEDG